VHVPMCLVARPYRLVRLGEAPSVCGQIRESIEVCCLCVPPFSPDAAACRRPEWYGRAKSHFFRTLFFLGDGGEH
jgi:hypothetical protein